MRIRNREIVDFWCDEPGTRMDIGSQTMHCHEASWMRLVATLNLHLQRLEDSFSSAESSKPNSKDSARLTH